MKRWRDLRQNLRRRLAMHFVADRAYLARLYHDKLGAWPDLGHPSGFNERILFKMPHDRRPMLTLFSDKRVRDYVRKAAPALALPTLYWWSPRADNLPFDELPDEFVLKANHGSGWNLIVGNKTAPGAQIWCGSAATGSSQTSPSSDANGPTATSDARCSRSNGCAAREMPCLRTTSSSSSPARSA